MNKGELKDIRKDIQIIFQDPYASLNPRMQVLDIIREPLDIHFAKQKKSSRNEQVMELMKKVGMEESWAKRYPHEFSGGQRQRISIARALITKPKFIICDESVSALDVSIQASILNLLLDLQEEFDLTYLFISHDLSVVEFVSDEVAVMNNGKIVELATSEDIYKNPKDEYTQKLLSAIPEVRVEEIQKRAKARNV
jgi:peptide/nickel transport system ATP-binding protein